MSDTRREMMRLVKQLRLEGFEVTRTGSGHWKVRGERGFVIMAFSPRTSNLYKTYKRLEEIGFTRK